MNELKAKIHNLILDRKQAIIDKYNNLLSPNMRLTLEQIEQCSRELVEDPIIVELNNQLIEIEMKSTSRTVVEPI